MQYHVESVAIEYILPNFDCNNAGDMDIGPYFSKDGICHIGPIQLGFQCKQ